jgi:hypothetical protein
VPLADPQQTRALRQPRSADKQTADTRRGDELRILSPELAAPDFVSLFIFMALTDAFPAHLPHLVPIPQRHRDPTA